MATDKTSYYLLCYYVGDVTTSDKQKNFSTIEGDYTIVTSM